jgi:flagellin
MQMADVNLSKAVRSNLLSLQSTAANMAKTQNRLATGLKVNSALDNPSNFFTASALNSRAGDMANLMDSMASGIQTIEAADNGLKSITKTVESMQSTLRQARQDKSFKTESYTLDVTRTAVAGDNIEFSGGAVGSTAVAVSVNKSTKTTAAAVPDVLVANNGNNFTVTDGTSTTGTVTLATGDTVQDIADKINTAAGANSTISASVNADNELVLASTEGGNLTVTDGGSAGASALLGFGATAYESKTVDEVVTSINNTTALEGKIRASNDNGKVRIENQSTTELTVTGVTTAGAIDGLAATDEIGGNDVRKNLVKQFNELRDQLDKFADDASFNGINLLRGDKLKLTFNETGTSTIEIQAKDEDGVATAINNDSLGISAAVDADFDSDTTLDTKLDGLKSALDSLRSQSSTFGSNLSVVENRQDFTKNMINTLETGAANLTLADTNEEAANLLALQTRQQLSSTALSMASQADQAVLRLF